ncbi:hypothetical protein BSI_43460 [Bacillus inaquosorum KCTC 13429]|uniref:Uncharacterized protein n=1 Tax=Bacillus inaquosorum KCTC 13429 TaxID=1236548 RepID=A0A9W5LE92_9BACI|nr:hypothetical protein BSI_43460 [Bacillus inaquosorum KCTC 13429]
MKQEYMYGAKLQPKTGVFCFYQVYVSGLTGKKEHGTN